MGKGKQVLEVNEQLLDNDELKNIVEPILDPKNIKVFDIEKISFDPDNARIHNRRNIESIKDSLTQFGQQKLIVVDQYDVIRAGNGTVMAAKELGWTKITGYHSELNDEQIRAFALLDNRTAELAEWDFSKLSMNISKLDGMSYDISKLGWTNDELGIILNATNELLLKNNFSDEIDKRGEEVEELAHKKNLSLAERFVIPPFSVLDARQGYWQDRKRAWLGLGMNMLS